MPTIIYETNCAAVSSDKLTIFAEGSSLIIRLNKNTTGEINVVINHVQIWQLLKAMLSTTKAGNVLYGK